MQHFVGRVGTLRREFQRRERVDRRDVEFDRIGVVAGHAADAETVAHHAGFGAEDERIVEDVHVLLHLDHDGQVAVRGFRVLEVERVLHAALGQLDLARLRVVLVDVRIGAFAREAPAQVRGAFRQQEEPGRILGVEQRGNQSVFRIGLREVVRSADVGMVALVELLRDGCVELHADGDVRDLAFDRDDLCFVRVQVEDGFARIGFVRVGGFAPVARLDNHLVAARNQVEVVGNARRGFVFADQLLGSAARAVRFDFVYPQRADIEWIVVSGRFRVQRNDLAGDREVQLQRTGRFRPPGVVFGTGPQQEQQAAQADEGDMSGDEGFHGFHLFTEHRVGWSWIPIPRRRSRSA